MATQHYLREQAITMLRDSEFDDPPSSMGEPYPWDWLFMARNRWVYCARVIVCVDCHLKWDR